MLAAAASSGCRFRVVSILISQFWIVSRHCSGILFDYCFFIFLKYFHWKLVELGLWRQSNIWRLLLNDSGVILDLLEIDLEQVFKQKVNSFNIYLKTKSENGKHSNLIFKSEHLVTNQAQGPCLKCAPGHDSIEDSSIIKSYCRRRRVLAFQNLIFYFRPNLGGGNFWTGLLFADPLPIWEFSEKFQIGNKHMFWGSGLMLLGSRVVLNWEFSEKFQTGKPSGEVVPDWKISEIVRTGFQKRI